MATPDPAHVRQNPIEPGEWDNETHLTAGRITWCMKVWPASCRPDGRELRQAYKEGRWIPTCLTCLAHMVANRINGMSEPEC